MFLIAICLVMSGVHNFISAQAGGMTCHMKKLFMLEKCVEIKQKSVDQAHQLPCSFAAINSAVEWNKSR